MSDKADKVINELTTFLSEKEREELNQVIGYLNTQKRKLSHNDPERIRLNFLQDFLELIARTGVKFHDDTNAPYLQGDKEGFLLTWLSISLGGTTVRTSKCFVTDLFRAFVTLD